MNVEKVVESTQEQAVAAWIGLINQMRIDDLIENLNRQDQNLDSAMESMNSALGKIEDLVVANRAAARASMGSSPRWPNAGWRMRRASSMAINRQWSGLMTTDPPTFYATASRYRSSS